MPDTVKEKELEESKLGPGKYSAKFKLVEQRLDIGAVGLKEPVGKIKLDEIDERMELNPNYDIDKPNKLTIKMMPDTEVAPPNPPDKILNPEKWQFYDANLNAIKPNLEIHTFAENIPLEA